MKKIILFVTIVFISSLSAFSQDLSVFDLKLNEPFNIRECNYVTGDYQFEGRKKVKAYKYTEEKPATGKCFQRVGMYYTVMAQPNSISAKNFPSSPSPVTDDKVKLVYSDEERPTIAESEDIWIGIQQSKLTGIRFYFQSLNEREVYRTVMNKYGKPSDIQGFYIENGIGGRKEYYKATWNLPKLKVTFFSLETNYIGYDPQKGSARGYASDIGSVTIEYKIAENRPKNTNPL